MADAAFAPTTSVTMNANKSVTANFIAGVKITVGKQGQGAVSPGTGVYPMGGTKTFTATPASGWRWSHWEGNLGGADGGDASLDLPMNQARSITAVFVEQVTLTMVKELVGNLPAEGGAVSPAVGETLHDKDAVVDLVATAEGGWRFKEWSGDKSGTNPTTTITMSANKSVTANFIQVHIVTTEVIEQGVIEPEGGTYDHGASQSFFFDRQSGHQFHHWAGLPDSHSTPAWGPGTSTTNPVNVTIEESLHLVGYDDEIIYTLTADVDADGCTGCAVDPPVAEYIEGTPGTVTATPGEGWCFAYWDGDVPEGKEEDNPLVMTMDDDKAVTAVMQDAVDLTTLPLAEGCNECQVIPESGSYPVGQVVEATATETDRWTVLRWIDDDDVEIARDTAAVSIAMDRTKTVRAVYKERITFTTDTTKLDGGATIMGQVQVNEYAPDPGPRGIYFHIEDGAPVDILIRAYPNPGYRFVEWQGETITPLPASAPAQGPAMAGTVSVVADTTVTAVFEPIHVDFSEDTGQKYGFDDFSDQLIPWKSVAIQDDDPVIAETSVDEPESVEFVSSNAGTMTSSPQFASGASTTLAINGVSAGEAYLTPSVEGSVFTPSVKLGVKVFDRIEDVKVIIKKVVLRAQDDVQSIPVGQLGTKFDSVCVKVGPNGILDTNKAGDDYIAPGNSGICIGANLTADTPANHYVGDPSTGQINAASIEDFLNNKVYNQCVVSFSVESDPDPVVVNYDLYDPPAEQDPQNKHPDGMLSLSDNSHVEEAAIIGAGATRPDAYYVFVVIDIAESYTKGYTYTNTRFIFLSSRTTTAAHNIAHELGHAFGGLMDITHIEGQGQLFDPQNLMSYSEFPSYRNYLLRVGQWNTIRTTRAGGIYP